MNKREFLAQLKVGRISSLYLFLGEEYEEEEAIRILKEILFNKKEDLIEFNCDLLYGDETTASSIIEIVDTLPFDLTMRLVIIKRIDGLPKSERKRLALYLTQGMPESTCLVMCGRLEGDDPLYKAIISCGGKVVNFWPPFKEELPSFIMDKAKRLGKKMDKEAARLLSEIDGRDLYGLMNEIERLILYVGEANSITVDDVLLSTGQCGGDIFDLLEAISKKDAKRALLSLRELLLKGSPPLFILSMIIKEIHLIYQVGFLLEEGRRPQGIMDDLGITKKRLLRLIPKAKSFKGMDLKKNLSYLLEADIALKSREKRYHPLILELLVMHLTGLL